MKYKQIILSSVLWRSLYLVTVLLLNILVARFLQAESSGLIYYITNYFSFILLVASVNLETGMIFYASKNAIAANRLITLSVLWSVIVSSLIIVFLFINYPQAGHELTSEQFILFAGTYITGVLFTTFFSALFYAQQDFALPNIILAVSNLLLIITMLLFFYVRGSNNRALFLNLYFFVFLFQGILLFIAFAVKNKLWWQWNLPVKSELKLLFRYSALALLANVVFFLLYRIDYWFIKNMCPSCAGEDLGNYIQVSKLGQLFLLLPTFISSAIFPRTAAGFREEVHDWLPVLIKGIFVIDMLAFIFLLFTGQWLFPWLFGKTFDHMYPAFILLTPGILSLSAISLIAAYNAGKDKVSTNVIGALLGLIFIIAGDWLFIPTYGIKAAAAISSAGYTVYLIYFVYIFKKQYRISIKDFFLPVWGDWQKLVQIFRRENN